MVMGLITVGGHARLQKQLQREKRKPSPEMRWLIEKLARKMGVKFQGEVLVSARIQAPAVNGWLHPKLVLPLRFAEFYSKQEMEFMLSHELVHLQRKDYLFITWALLLKCVYWFNPLVYLAYPLFRLDQELACDQLVLTSVAPQERKSYGLTILKTASQPEMMFENFQAGCFWFTFSQMKERIAMINHHRNSKGRSMLALLSMIVLGFTALTFAASDMVKDPTTGKMVSAPEYGGTITYPYKLVGETTDPFQIGTYAVFLIDSVNEHLATGDWGIDREEFDFRTPYVPMFANVGQLAESWEQPDPLTYIFHIRPGVHWALNPDSEASRLVNGRELTADDVAYTFQRNLVLGDFTERPVMTYELINLPWESIEATDKYTVVMKMTESSLGALRNIIAEMQHWILPPEVIEKYGNYEDWKNVVGTGPLMLTDYVEGVSITYTKNPNYWGYDPKYPENRLPYIDKMRALHMSEEATRLSALRTGKVDIIHPFGATAIKVLDVVRSLQKTNPEIEVHSFFDRATQVFTLNIRKPPFDDIRVRHAMQMALDLETINDTYYGGFARWEPMGLISHKPYATTFEEYPEELKQYWIYDPEGAEKLLDEAGYPRGADGVRLKVNYDHRDVIDLGYAEIAIGYWEEIGVDVTTEIYDTTGWAVRRKEMEWDMSTGDMAFPGNPAWVIGIYRAEGGGFAPLWRDYVGGVETPELTAAYDAFYAATTIEEQLRAFKEYDMAVIKQHNQIWGPMAPGYHANQPWLKGYNGEKELGVSGRVTVLSRLWIDQELKQAMGR